MNVEIISNDGTRVDGVIAFDADGQTDWVRQSNVVEMQKYLAEANKKIEDLSRHLSNIHQDCCENARVEVSLFDAARQALFEICPEHPSLQNKPPNFGAWESQRIKIEDLQERLENSEHEAEEYSRDATHAHELNSEYRGVILKLEKALTEAKIKLGDDSAVDNFGLKQASPFGGGRI